MPNNVRSSVTITGSKPAIDAFAAKHFTMTEKTDLDGPHLSFDFNTIIPKPACLEGVTAGSVTERGVEGLTGKPYHESFTGELAAIHRQVAKGFPMRTITEESLTPEEREAGTKALAAIAECGYPTWYEWCNEKWGTKWNAYRSTGPTVTPIPKPKGHVRLTFEFESAWDTPRPIWAALKTMYPELHFIVDLDGEIDQEETLTFGMRQ